MIREAGNGSWGSRGEKLADESNESVMFPLPAGLVSSLSAS